MIMLLPFSAVSQNQNFNVGSTLFATINNSSSWLSTSGDFAFGFQQLQRPKETFLLCIWYAKIPDNTIVWYANKNAPATLGSTVVITSDQGLVLKDPRGKTLWNSESIVRNVSHGFMNDTGNFQLIGSDSDVLWQSFQNPTDTLLPTQVIPMDDRRLISRRSQTNFSNGRFELRFQGDGNLVLYSVNLPTDKLNAKYYESRTFDETNSSNAGKELIFGESGYIYMTRRGGGIVNLTTEEVNGSQEDYYYRATLNFDGVFILFRYPKKLEPNQTWSSIWFKPTDICRYPSPIVAAGSGACGYNSLCRLNIDSRPTCGCPMGYALADPNDPYGDCVPDFHLSTCAVDEPYNRELYDIVRLANVDLPSMDYTGFSPYSEEQCQEACLSDCMCAVAVFDSNNCWKKGLPLSYGRSDASLKPITYFKVGKRPLPIPPVTPNSSFPDTDDKTQGTIILAGSVLLGGSVLINLILLGGICFAFFFIYNKRLKQGGSVADTNLRCFTFKELSDATDEFKEELGRGASGIVYKGKIQASSGSGATFVAIKKLDRVVENDKEFKTEMNIIGQTHHKNLVRLVGFCHEGSNRLLVYEFLSNGSLASLLFGELRPSWSQRVQIAFGISRGLVYLHEECATQIIHCDIKPQNILLDDYYTARISDFGLSKLLTLDQSQTQTGIRGTKGYVAPEWFRCTPVTTKVDVYSFGVLLLEIICCRKCVQMMGTEDSYGRKTILVDWAYDCYREGTLWALVEDDVEATNDISRVEKFVIVALWCIQEDPQQRPNMRKVTQMLEGVVEVKVPQDPSPYSYYADDGKEQLVNADEVSLLQD